MNRMRSFVLIAALLVFNIGFSAQATNIPASTLGMIVSAPVGAVVGLVRGSGNKGIEYSKTFSKKLGNSLPAKTIAAPIGMVVGLSSGSTYGAIRGISDGVGYSLDSPFSAESFSMSGKFWDYDPFNIADF